MTSGAHDLMLSAGVNAFQLLLRHQRGDWGDLCTSDRVANDYAVINGTRIHSVYAVGKRRQKLWVVTG